MQKANDLFRCGTCYGEILAAIIEKLPDFSSEKEDFYYGQVLNIWRSK